MNFVLVGSASQVTEALKAAGWIQADKTDKEAIVGALLTTLTRNSYMAVPLSMLYLLDALRTTAMSAPSRLWSRPSAIICASGRRRGPRRSRRFGQARHSRCRHRARSALPNGITHRIDQDVDNERDFIGATLQQAGQVEAMSYLTRAHPITAARTATGGDIKSDGRVLVIVLKPRQTAVR